MYLLLERNDKLSFQYLVLSVIIHLSALYFTLNYVTKLSFNKAIKKEFIEFEIAALSPSGALLEKSVNSYSEPSQYAKKTDAQKVQPQKAQPQVEVNNLNSDFTPEEDFEKLDLKGRAWEPAISQDKAPEIEDLVDKSGDSGDSYAALQKNYENEELDSDLQDAQKKNSYLVQAEAKKLNQAIESDAQELTAHTNALIQKEKQKKYKSGSQSATVAQTKILGRVDAVAQVVGSANFNSKDSSGVRALGELKQMPGNKKPEYDLGDRRADKQGQVIYHAFINSEGYPEKFNLVKSSGHASLDSNTLWALKKWRFYPGQEGWVELPFKWSLKGGAVEAPSLLRIKN
jgi:TonB family protein